MPETARVSDVGDELELVPCASATAEGVPGGAGCSDDDSIDGDLLLGVYAVPCEHEHAPDERGVLGAIRGVIRHATLT